MTVDPRAVSANRIMESIDPKTITVLKAARARIEREGFKQAVPGTRFLPEGPGYDLTTAISGALGCPTNIETKEEFHAAYRTLELNRTTVRAIERYLLHVIGGSTVLDLILYNDAAGRTKADVLLVLSQAIQMAEFDAVLVPTPFARLRPAVA